MSRSTSYTFDSDNVRYQWLGFFLPAVIEGTKSVNVRCRGSAFPDSCLYPLLKLHIDTSTSITINWSNVLLKTQARVKRLHGLEFPFLTHHQLSFGLINKLWTCVDVRLRMAVVISRNHSNPVLGGFLALLRLKINFLGVAMFHTLCSSSNATKYESVTQKV